MSAPSNAELEQRWIDAWSALYDVFGGVGGGECILPDGSVVDFDAGLAYLQDSAYQGYRLAVQASVRDGRRVAVLTRTPWFVEPS